MKDDQRTGHRMRILDIEWYLCYIKKFAPYTTSPLRVMETFQHGHGVTRFTSWCSCWVLIFGLGISFFFNLV